MPSRPATVTTASLALRGGPGTTYPVIAWLARGTRVDVARTEGNWQEVRWGRTAGFAHKNFLFLPEAEPPQGFLRERATLRDAPLGAPEGRRLSPGRDAAPEARLAAEAWNRFGGLLEPLCAELGLDAGAGVAVLCVESAGHGFGPDGRLKIRFENHIFWQRWGRTSAGQRTLFERHFRFDVARRWQRHEFRAHLEATWVAVHRSQATEWQALQLARSLDETEALCSTSMGSPQLMGFHWASVGYQSVQEMFSAFGDPAEGERDQILGLLDFIKGPGNGSPMLAALQRGDYVAFAGRYNGPGRALAYAETLERYAAAFAALRVARA